MRDWVLVILPVALVVYFLVFPDHLISVVRWVDGIVFKH
jgi:hypothetical protein